MDVFLMLFVTICYAISIADISFLKYRPVLSLILLNLCLSPEGVYFVGLDPPFLFLSGSDRKSTKIIENQFFLSNVTKISGDIIFAYKKFIFFLHPFSRMIFFQCRENFRFFYPVFLLFTLVSFLF